MNTRSLIKAHGLALPVINFPMLLHWQPTISATDSQLPAASEASAAGEEKLWFRVEQDLPLPFCSSVLGRSRSVPPALHTPRSWDRTLLPGPGSSVHRKGLVVQAQATSNQAIQRVQEHGCQEGVAQGRVVFICMACSLPAASCSLFLSPCIHIFVMHLPPLAGAETGVLSL